MALRLKTEAGEIYFNPQTIARVHLSSDHAQITVHFINGTHYTTPVDTDEERAVVAQFLIELTREQSGFYSSGGELLNLKTAYWILLPEDGPIEVRAADNRTHSLRDQDKEPIRQVLER